MCAISYSRRSKRKIELPKQQINENQKQAEAAPQFAGRLVALDLGQKRVGVAVSDEMRLTVRPLQALARTNWKKLLREVSQLVREFDACALVIGLPLSMDGSVGTAAGEAQRLARNFSLSLSVPVYLQDERLTSREAEESLRADGHLDEALSQMIDSESAAIILRDFLADASNRPGRAS
ncbi:MAG TPA: Holliday junction resolvase RuvX [Pyrinomonadaceae bacterium]